MITQNILYNTIGIQTKEGNFMAIRVDNAIL